MYLLLLGMGTGIVGGLMPSPLHFIALSQVALNRWVRALSILVGLPLIIDGTLLLVASAITPGRPTFRSIIYRSVDRGVSWKQASVLDIGGHGDHDGIFEGCLASLGGGSVLGMFRTNKDSLFEVRSSDNGKTWSKPSATSIHASSSPCALLKMKSGRLVLAYNPVQSTDRRPIIRSGPPASLDMASWFRGQLLVRSSWDNGLTWSAPKIAIESASVYAAYPQMTEVRPGVVWLSTGLNRLCLECQESEF